MNEISTSWSFCWKSVFEIVTAKEGRRLYQATSEAEMKVSLSNLGNLFRQSSVLKFTTPAYIAYARHGFTP
jgi:hypothetical protein